VLKAKFHYAIWFEAGSKLVEPVCDQLRTSFEPVSVWNLAFYGIIMYNSCRTQHSTEQFWYFSLLSSTESS